MAKALVGAYVATVLALMVGAASIWSLRCEGFGCVGIGVAWFAWVVAFLAALGIGAFTRMKAASVVGLARASTVAWWVQLAVGAVAAVVWLAQTAA